MKFGKSKMFQIREHEQRVWYRELRLYQNLIQVHAAGFLILMAGLSYLLFTQPSPLSSRSVWIVALAALLLGLDAIYFVVVQNQRKAHLESDKSWDEVTGAWSAAYFENKLQEEIVSAGRYRYPLSLCVIDLDHFRSFNENFGPKRGDELLKQFAALMQSHIRATDLLARFEDDAFYLLLPHTDLIRSQRVVERLLEQSVEELDVNFRAGLTAYQIGENVNQFQNRAKAALGNAKREGSRRVQCVISDGDNYTTIEF